MTTPKPIRSRGLRITMLAFLAFLLEPLAGRPPAAPAVEAAQDGPVTVTLVRWPYT